ncbi:MAG TPA: peptidoglycan-associated lipoprotein Pal [Thermoanaerobaculia bacterium]|nr:peptidoglycan-associated lipoprotein Pal [Thermoanaerobaculia bacterium]
MKKAVQGFFLGLTLIAVVLAPACRSKKAPPPPQVTPTETTASVPNVPAVATTTETHVTNPPDFVQPQPSVTVETLPTDVDELNKVVHDKGYLQDAFFAFDDSTLSASAQSALQASATWLKQNAQYNLLIEGHCDERGTEQYNLALGDRRANTAKDYLVALGVDASRIRTVSYGEERPFDPGHTEEAWAQNRRDHLVIVGK